MTTKIGAFLLVIFLAMRALGGLAAAEQKSMVFPELSSVSLLNDLQVYVAATPYLGSGMTIGLVLRYGSAFDPADKGGLAYLAGQMFGRATLEKTSKDIQDELKDANVSLEVQCDWDGIRFLMRAPSDAFERCLYDLYQIVCEAEFKDDDFAKVKAALMQQLQAPEDPRQQAHGQLEAVLFRGTTYGRPLRGTPASVQNITAGDVRYFYRRYFSPGQASLVIVGSVPAQTVLEKARRIWGLWVRTDEIPNTFVPAREPAGLNIFLEDDPGSPAAQYILGNLWPTRGDPVYYSATLAARMLQARLTQVLPTSRLTVADEGRRLRGPFYIQGQAAADQAVGEINKIIDAVEAFKASPVSAEEVAKAQDQWIEEFGKTIRSTDGVCNVLLDSELYRLGINYLSTFSDFVHRSSPAMIKDAAAQCLFPGGLILIVRGPASILRPQLESLGAVQLLKR
jgi:zinc protease